MNTLKRIIIGVCIVGSAAIVAHATNLGSVLLVFLIAGIIPGTDLTMPAPLALIVSVLVGVLIIVGFRRSIAKEIIRARHQHRLPTRRFGSF